MTDLESYESVKVPGTETKIQEMQGDLVDWKN